MTPELKAFVDALRAKFPQYFSSGEIYSLGVTNCRTKNNKVDGPWSEHSWSNAVDIMLRTVDGVPGDKIAAWARSRPDLASEVFWKIFAHHNHVHVTANPRRNYDNKQIPPCAGGEENEGEEDMEQVLRLFVTEAIAKGWLGWPVEGTFWLNLCKLPNDPQWRNDFEPAWNRWKAQEGIDIANGLILPVPATTSIDLEARGGIANIRTKLHEA